MVFLPGSPHDLSPLLTALLLDASRAPGDRLSPAVEYVSALAEEFAAANLLAELERLLARTPDPSILLGMIAELLTSHWGDDLGWLDAYLRRQRNTSRRRQALARRFVSVRDALDAFKAAKASGDKAEEDACERRLTAAIAKLQGAGRTRDRRRAWRRNRRQK